VLRSIGELESARATVRSAQRWYSTAGGGDGATLAEYLVAALDADDGAPDAQAQLAAVLAAARDAHDVEIEVLALDRMARIYAEQGRTTDAREALGAADRAMGSASHLLAMGDRVDRDPALSRIEASPS
jgi:hypothetical protein